MPSSTSACLERARRRVAVGLEQQLDAVGRLGRHDRQPAVVAQREVGLLLEAQDVRVEPERLLLVVDQDARER